MALTYAALATVTVGSGGAANIEFNSIPGTYTDLVMLVSLRDADTGGDWSEFYIKPNGTTSNQTTRALFGTGSTVSQDTAGDARGWLSNASCTVSTFGSSFIYIPNYAGSTVKQFSVDSGTENNNTSALRILGASKWDSTTAITSITLSPAVANFSQYSTATLYGIKNTV